MPEPVFFWELDTPAVVSQEPCASPNLWMGLPFPGCFPGDASGKEATYQCRRHKRCGFNPWVRKIPWGRKWQSTPEFLPRKSHAERSLGCYSPRGCKEADTAEITKHSTAAFSWQDEPSSGHALIASSSPFVCQLDSHLVCCHCLR